MDSPRPEILDRLLQALKSAYTLSKDMLEILVLLGQVNLDALDAAFELPDHTLNSPNSK